MPQSSEAQQDTTAGDRLAPPEYWCFRCWRWDVGERHPKRDDMRLCLTCHALLGLRARKE